MNGAHSKINLEVGKDPCRRNTFSWFEYSQNNRNEERGVTVFCKLQNLLDKSTTQGYSGNMKEAWLTWQKYSNNPSYIFWNE